MNTNSPNMIFTLNFNIFLLIAIKTFELISNLGGQEPSPRMDDRSFEVAGSVPGDRTAPSLRLLLTKHIQINPNSELSSPKITP